VKPEAMDLVKKLLTKEKEHRIVIEKILEHPWLVDGDSNLLSKRKNSGDYIEKFKAMSLTSTD
jgi:serine/threonine protein kinase